MPYATQADLVSRFGERELIEQTDRINGAVVDATVVARELDYVGVFRAAHAFDWAVQALRSRRVDVRALISAQMPIAQAQAAFELALDRSKSTKVQLVAG